MRLFASPKAPLPYETHLKWQTKCVENILLIYRQQSVNPSELQILPFQCAFIYYGHVRILHVCVITKGEPILDTEALT